MTGPILCMWPGMPWHALLIELSKHEKSGSSTTQGIISLCRNAFGHQTWQGVTYCEGFPAIKPHKSLITWFCEITKQTKVIISPLPQLLWSARFGRVANYLEESS